MPTEISEWLAITSEIENFIMNKQSQLLSEALVGV